ncbi:MAG: winged helix-turn-helix domain-containing protein [Wenzhouxiangellaceae bacterium]
MNERGTIYRFGEYELCVQTRELLHNGKRVEIQERIFCLLAFLIENRDRAVSKEELVAAIWEDKPISETVIPRAIMKARRAVGDDGTPPSTIRTIRGYGYRFMVEPEVSYCPTVESSEELSAEYGKTGDATGEDVRITAQPETRAHTSRPGRKLPQAPGNGMRSFTIIAALLIMGILIAQYGDKPGALRDKIGSPHAVFALKLSPDASPDEHLQAMTTRVTALLALKLSDISWIDEIYFSENDQPAPLDHESCELAFWLAQSGTKYRIEYTLSMPGRDPITGTLIDRTPSEIADALVTIITGYKAVFAD